MLLFLKQVNIFNSQLVEDAFIVFKVFLNVIKLKISSCYLKNNLFNKLFLVVVVFIISHYFTLIVMKFSVPHKKRKGI